MRCQLEWLVMPPPQLAVPNFMLLAVACLQHELETEAGVLVDINQSINQSIYISCL